MHLKKVTRTLIGAVNRTILFFVIHYMRKNAIQNVIDVREIQFYA